MLVIILELLRKLGGEHCINFCQITRDPAAVLVCVPAVTRLSTIRNRLEWAVRFKEPPWCWLLDLLMHLIRLKDSRNEVADVDHRYKCATDLDHGQHRVVIETILGYVDKMAIDQ